MSSTKRPVHEHIRPARPPSSSRPRATSGGVTRSESVRKLERDLTRSDSLRNSKSSEDVPFTVDVDVDQSSLSHRTHKTSEAANFPLTAPLTDLPSTKEMIQTRQQNEGLESENACLRKKVASIGQRVAKMETLLSESAARDSRKLKQMSEAFQDEYACLVEKYKGLEVENKRLEKVVSSINQDNDALQARIEKADKKLKDSKEMSTFLEEELNEVWAENEENKAMADKMERERDAAEEEASRLQLKIEALDIKSGGKNASRSTDIDNSSRDLDRDQEARIRFLEVELEKTLTSGMERTRSLDMELKGQRNEVDRLRRMAAAENKEVIQKTKDVKNGNRRIGYESPTYDDNDLQVLKLTPDSDAPPTVYVDSAEMDTDDNLSKSSSPDARKRKQVSNTASEVSSEREGKRRSWAEADLSEIDLEDKVSDESDRDDAKNAAAAAAAVTKNTGRLDVITALNNSCQDIPIGRNVSGRKALVDKSGFGW